MCQCFGWIPIYCLMICSLTHPCSPKFPFQQDMVRDAKSVVFVSATVWPPQSFDSWSFCSLNCTLRALIIVIIILVNCCFVHVFATKTDRNQNYLIMETQTPESFKKLTKLFPIIKRLSDTVGIRIVAIPFHDLTGTWKNSRGNGHR